VHPDGIPSEAISDTAFDAPHTKQQTGRVWYASDSVSGQEADSELIVSTGNMGAHNGQFAT
jgi:hypothetical protein